MSGADHQSSGFTTERIYPAYYLSTRSDAFIYACHLATYDFAAERVAGKKVLDLGCGIGYGTHRIAPICSQIVGVDISAEAIDEATARFQAPNLSFERIAPAEDAPLRFEDGEFDVILSFQVFEHLSDPDAYLRQVRRLLAPGGLFICVTPDRSSRLLPRQRPWNEFHLHEYSQAEMADVLGAHFGSVEVAGMSARPDLLAIETRRVNKLRWAALPVTFPGVPETWRVKGIQLLKRMEKRRAEDTTRDATDSPLDEWDFDESDVEVFSRRSPSMNVVCLARAPKP